MTKRILIIGGMGPQASVLLHKRILGAAVKCGATGGADFPAITHVSLPIPDFISSPTNLSSAVRLIRESLRYLWQSSI